MQRLFPQVPAASAIATYATNDTDLVIDINGYFAAPGSGRAVVLSADALPRLDTRHVGNGQPFSGELTVPVETVRAGRRPLRRATCSTRPWCRRGR